MRAFLLLLLAWVGPAHAAINPELLRHAAALAQEKASETNGEPNGRVRLEAGALRETGEGELYAGITLLLEADGTLAELSVRESRGDNGTKEREGFRGDADTRREAAWTCDGQGRMTSAETVEELEWHATRVLEGDQAFELGQEILDRTKDLLGAKDWASLIETMRGVVRGTGFNLYGQLMKSTPKEAVRVFMRARGSYHYGKPLPGQLEDPVLTVIYRPTAVELNSEDGPSSDKSSYSLVAELDGTPLRLEHRLDRLARRVTPAPLGPATDARMTQALEEVVKSLEHP